MEPRRTLILSDLHLGRPKHAARGPEHFRDLWRGFDRIIFNGDLAEIHHPRHRLHAAREVVRLLDLCEQDGIEIIILAGNHDPFISEQRRISLAGGEVFITHGDVFHPAVAPWSPAAPEMEEVNEAAYATLRENASSALEARLEAAQHASHAEWLAMEKQAGRSTIHGMLLRPWAILHVLWYWRRFPSIVARFADEHDISARFIISGHTHHPGVWERSGRIIINTGSYGFPGSPLAVTLEDRTLAVWNIEWRDGRYRRAAEPLRSFALGASSPGTAAHASAANTRDDSGRPSAAAM